MSGHWADYDIVHGMDNEHYQPNANMTRAQMATILTNLLGLKATITNVFEDVSSGAWYEDAVLKCAAAEIIKGMSDTKAALNDLITREQAFLS